MGSNVFERYPEIFFEHRQHAEQIRIYGRQNNQRVYRYIDKKYIISPENLEGWKVFVAKSMGSGALGEALSSLTIGEPNVGNTQTFISLGNFQSEYEAKSLIKYLKTKFARVILGIKKITQDNATKEVWSKVPLQDFGLNSDMDWSKSITEIDALLYKKYNLSEEEINFIESIAKEMK